MLTHIHMGRICKPKKAPKGALIDIINYSYFLPFGAKKEHTITKTTKPTNPPWPKPETRDVKFAITSIPNTDVPESTNHKIDIGTNAKNNFPSPPKKSVNKLNTFSIFLDLID